MSATRAFKCINCTEFAIPGRLHCGKADCAALFRRAPLSRIGPGAKTRISEAEYCLGVHARAAEKAVDYRDRRRRRHARQLAAYARRWWQRYLIYRAGGDPYTQEAA